MLETAEEPQAPHLQGDPMGGIENPNNIGLGRNPVSSLQGLLSAMGFAIEYQRLAAACQRVVSLKQTLFLTLRVDLRVGSGRRIICLSAAEM